MSPSHRIILYNQQRGYLTDTDGNKVVIPDTWDFLPAGDAAVTRKVKAKGETWMEQVRYGRRMISRGIYASREHITEAKAEIAQLRSTPEYKKARQKALARREAEQSRYEQTFHQEVLGYLKFAQKYHREADQLASLVCRQAVPVGSGTVARTRRISIEERAAAAVIAWLRHNTTGYDTMSVPRIKGKRREIRRKLARDSVDLLNRYRRGEQIPSDCPLRKALRQTDSPGL